MVQINNVIRRRPYGRQPEREALQSSEVVRGDDARLSAVPRAARSCEPPETVSTLLTDPQSVTGFSPILSLASALSPPCLTRVDQPSTYSHVHADARQHAPGQVKRLPVSSLAADLVKNLTCVQPKCQKVLL